MADEFACSAEAASFFLAQDVWTTDLGRQGLPFWLPLAAIDHGVSVGQAALGRRGAVAAPRPAPLGPTVGRVAGALFSLAERFESLWLDRRGSEPVRDLRRPARAVGGRRRGRSGANAGGLSPGCPRSPADLGADPGAGDARGRARAERRRLRRGRPHRPALGQDRLRFPPRLPGAGDVPDPPGAVARAALPRPRRGPRAARRARGRPPPWSRRWSDWARVFEEEKPYLMDRWR